MPRVFISYVRENSKDVIRLVNALKARQVEVWFDQTHLQPGDRWADVIRREIAHGDFFIACFSTEFSKRRKTFMHEEITQAIEQLRQRLAEQPWFIPVLLSDCEIPDRSIGAGETLRSIQWVALYDDWNEGIRRILAVVQVGPEGEPLDSRQQNAYSEIEADSLAAIDHCMHKLLEGEDAVNAARFLGDIAIRNRDEAAINCLWHSAQNTKKPNLVVDHCAYSIGRILIQSEDLDIKRLCFDIIEKSIESKSDIVVDKFAYMVGEVVLSANDESTRVRALEFVERMSVSTADFLREKYSYTKKRIQS